MEFKEFVSLLQEHFKEMSKDATHLFEAEVDKDYLWNLYLDSFPSGTNGFFRERRVHDCSACRHFVKTIGNVVTIKDNKITTLWDFQAGSEEYQPVVNALAEHIRSLPVSYNVWLGDYNHVGIEKNYETSNNSKIITWYHFFAKLPDRFVNKTNKSLGDIRGSFRDTRNVFKRSLDEITEESILTLLELISQNSLYKGEEWKYALERFLEYKKKYVRLHNDTERELFSWEQSLKAGEVVGRIRNHSIGTLLVNISEGMDLDLAVRKYEKIVAPNNYKRSKPIYTKSGLPIYPWSYWL